MEKNSFVIYHKYRDILKDLTNEQVGILFRTIFDYEIDKKLPNLEGELKMAFNFVKADLDLNSNKYNNICERNRINGQSGGRPKNEQNDNKPKKPTGLFENPKNPEKPKKPDNDNDNDNDNDIIKEKVKKEKFVPPTLEEVQKYAKCRGREDLAIKFFDYFNAGKWIDSEGKPVLNWKQKFITWDSKNKQISKIKNREYTREQLDNLFDDITNIEF